MQERLQQLKEQIKGVKCQYYILDLTNFDQYESVIEEIVREYGKISSFIYSAGVEMVIDVGFSAQ